MFDRDGWFTGCAPHASEGKGESHPAPARPEQAESPARPTNGSMHALSNGHAAAHGLPGRPSGHADVLSGEDSAPDDGPAVTSPPTGSTPGAHPCLLPRRLPLRWPVYLRRGVNK